MAAVWQASGTLLGSTGADITPVNPAHQADDILILHAAARSNSPTLTTPSGWNLKSGPNDQGTTWRHYLFWKRAAGGSETNPLCDWSNTTGDKYGVVHNLRGAVTTGDPFEALAFTGGTASPGVATGVTSLTDAALICSIGMSSDNTLSAVAATATDPSSLTQRDFEAIPTGADASMWISTANRTAAGATGNVSHAWTGAQATWGIYVAAIKAAAGTLTSVSYTGANTPAGAARLQPQQRATGAFTPVGAFIQALIKRHSGGVTPAGSATFEPIMAGPTPIAAAMAGLAETRAGRALAGRPPVTGTLFQVAYTGAIVPAGAAILRGVKVLVGANTPAGAFIKSLTKFFTGANTPTGTALKRPNKFFAGGNTPTGAATFARIIRVFYTGSLTPAGAIVQRVTKLLAGSNTPAGAVIKSLAQRFSGANTPAGVIRKTLTKLFAGSAGTPVGSLIKKPIKLFAGALTPTGALTVSNVIIRAYTGAVTLVGEVQKTPIKALSGVVSTLTGAILKRPNLSRAGSFTPSGVYRNPFISTRFAGTLLPTGAAIVSRIIVAAYTGAITAVGEIRKTPILRFLGSLLPTGTIPLVPYFPGFYRTGQVIYRTARRVISVVASEPVVPTTPVLYRLGDPTNDDAPPPIRIEDLPLPEEEPEPEPAAPVRLYRLGR